MYLSNDDSYVVPTKVGVRGSGLTSIDFGGAQLVRYVYFRLSGTRASWLSIDEINVIP